MFSKNDFFVIDSVRTKIGVILFAGYRESVMSIMPVRRATSARIYTFIHELSSRYGVKTFALDRRSLCKKDELRLSLRGITLIMVRWMNTDRMARQILSSQPKSQPRKVN